MSAQSLQPRRHTGFSLVEIMVGMVIGMLSIIIMMQMFSAFENQKRTTSSGDDAQNSGAIALHHLQRDIQQSGYGISRIDLLGCQVLLRTGGTLSAIAPLTIYPAGMVDPPIPAGDANTDTLLVVYGNGNGPVEGEDIDSGSVAGAISNFTTHNTPSSIPADNVIAGLGQQSSSCSLTLGIVTDVTGNSVTMSASGVNSVTVGTLYNLGREPKVLAYAIRSGNLTVCDYMSANCGDNTKKNDASVWVPIASDIVSMRAQYGRDDTSPMDGIVDVYDQTTPATSCGWAKAPAVRIALVARGVVQGKKVTTGTLAWPQWSGSTVAANNPTAVPLQLSANLSDTKWQLYHYKVFETIVPLRNVTWMGVQTGC